MQRPVLAGFFGKIPATGDFVGRGLPVSFVQPWELWAAEALRQSRALLGDAWLEAWLVAPVWRFRLPAGACGPDAALGLVLPSIDRVGRAWPLVVAFVLQRSGFKPALRLRHMVAPATAGIDASAGTNTGVDGGPPPAMTVEGSASDGEADAFDPLLANAEATAREAIAEDMQPDAFAARLQGLPGRHFVTLPQQSARWWTHGGPNVAPQSLTLAGLPAMPQFAGLLAGERG
nr:type VI secretion system-associated protein TagF [uncultured Rhodopila sp.]